MANPDTFVIACPQRGCAVPLKAGDAVPELCPVCRNPLAVLVNAKPKRARSSKRAGHAQQREGAEG